jgi:hypothetical protein
MHKYLHEELGLVDPKHHRNNGSHLITLHSPSLHRRACTHSASPPSPQAALCLESEIELQAIAPKESSRQLTARIRNTRTWQELQPLVILTSRCGDAINVSSCASQLSRLLRNKRLSSTQVSEVHSSLAHLIERSRSMMFDFDAQGLASLTSAMARLDYTDEAFVADLMQHSMQRMYQFSPQALATMIWALARLDEQPYPLWLETFFDEVYIKLVGGGLCGAAAACARACIGVHSWWVPVELRWCYCCCLCLCCQGLCVSAART